MKFCAQHNVIGHIRLDLALHLGWPYMTLAACHLRLSPLGGVLVRGHLSDGSYCMKHVLGYSFSRYFVYCGMIFFSKRKRSVFGDS